MLSGFCGTTTQNVGTNTSGVLLGLGSEDVSNAFCFNNESASSVVGIPITSAGTLKNLTVASNSNIISPALLIQATVYVNGGLPTGYLYCTFTTGPPAPTSSCHDSSDTMTVNPGDVVAVVLSLPNGGTIPTSNALSIHVALEKQ
jgi:hypothetical protein